MNTNPTCSTCRWFAPWGQQPAGNAPDRENSRRTVSDGRFSPDTVITGDCRHKSPHVVTKTHPGGGSGPYTKWPSVRSVDWCGHHRSHPETEEAHDVD